jgi:hypothetical protein
MTEQENIDAVIRLLSKDFVCVIEDNANNKRILGKHPTGKNLFIDALIRPKNPAGWRNGKSTVFGIEFKRNYEKGGNLIKHIAQSIDYSNSEWYYNGKKIGMIPILLFPSPSQFNPKAHFSTGEIKDHPYSIINAFVIRLLGTFNIGTIEIFQRQQWPSKTKETILQIALSGASLYRTDTGVSLNSAKNKLELKTGSR